MDNNIKVTEQDILKDERIDVFLCGKMSDADAKQFMEDIKTNPELKAKAVAMARLIKAMDKVGRQHEAEIVKSIRSISEEEFMEITKEATTQGKAKTIPLWRKHMTILSIAASLLILITVGGGYQYMDYRHTQSLADTYAIALDSPSYIKGEENADVEKELATLFLNVKTGEDTDATILRLTELWELSKQDTYNDYTNFSEEIGYELAVAHLRDNDKKAAKQVLQSLSGTIAPESELGKKVYALLKELQPKSGG